MESYTVGEILEKCLTILGGFSGVFTIVVGIARLFGKNLLAHWFNKDLETHKAALIRTTNELQERLRIEYSSIFAERLSVFKESIVRICKAEKIMHQLASYDQYECKENLDYSEKECSDKGCAENCIVHYWTIINELHTYARECVFFFQSNEMFFSIAQSASYLQLFADIILCYDEVYKLQVDTKVCAKTKALTIFARFADLHKSTIEKNLRKDLVDSYRSIIKVPVYEKIREI